MAATPQLPSPHLSARLFGARRLPALTDDALFAATGVRIAFTGREGGVSEGPFASLNLGALVDDSPQAVAENRRVLLEALDSEAAALVVPRQVHGDAVVCIDDAAPQLVEAARIQAEAGADALVVNVAQVAALLCFADCVPVIIVSPSGRFAVAHAGWRGVLNGVAAKSVRELVRADAPVLGPQVAAMYNVYVGPHIHTECFETGTDVRDQFAERFGHVCTPGARQVDLLAALTEGLAEAGIARERIVDAGVCTRCAADEYFSYRASGGVCGRHGALAVRKAD